MHTKDSVRILWIDALKGAGILFVVAGHIFNSRFFYVFHMPMFFFIAGLTLRPQLNIGRFIRKKSSQLLIPYFSFMAAISVATRFISNNYGGG